MAAKMGWWGGFIDCFYIVLFFICCILSSVTQGEQLDLVFVQMLFRHGDRSPVTTYPTNPNPESMWPQGFGQLTQDGMRQHNKLGAYMRDRYTNGKPYTFLSKRYDRLEIRIQSTDYDRTLMSAYSHLSGLFPPDKAQTFDANITWQPIPVHTEPLDEDHLLYMDAPCPEYHKSYNATLKSDFVKKEEQENKEFYQYVSKESGVNNETISTIWQVYDPLYCMHMHPEIPFKPQPWLNKTFDGKPVLDKMAELESFQFDLMFDDPVRRRLRGGNLVGEMVKNMMQRIKNTIIPSQRKYLIYSAHDTTVAALLSALQVFNKLFPPYHATVILELHKGQETGEYFVKVLYKNDTLEKQQDPYNLTIPGCPVLCPFNKFVELTKDVIPEDWEVECGLKPSALNLNLILIISISTVGSLFIVALIFGIVMWRKKRRAVLNYGRYSSLTEDG